ncbi:MAG TPA: penicillin acylase family protein, partial [Roseiarcus sp.]|nr:penicillin acylase family protein [Roseiarcus sp.]
FTWGEANRAGVRHPLVRALPALDLLLDPPDEPLPGDLYQPRVAAPGFGASVRFVVSPGHEARGLLHMPTGQSGNPLSPYYNLGHDDWAKGRPAPFLPGAAKWRLEFRPS